MPKWLSFTIITLLGVYALALQSKDQLILYINPRYLLSATLAAVLCIVIGLAGYIWLIMRYKKGMLQRLKGSFVSFIESLNLGKSKMIAIVVAAVFALFTPLGFVLLVLVILIPFSDQEELLSKSLLIEFLVFCFIALGFLLPAQSLSSQTASQRSTSLNTVTLNGELSATTLFSFDSDKYDVGDWIRRINADPNLSDYVGKEVNVTGFVFKPKDYPADMFLASRFLVSCCAVDARPIGLPVRLQGWDAQYASDEWLNVSGKFELEEVNGEQVLVIVPVTNPEKTAQPARPYIY